jgi:hypothetical protein
MGKVSGVAGEEEEAFAVRARYDGVGPVFAVALQ